MQTLYNLVVEKSQNECTPYGEVGCTDCTLLTQEQTSENGTTLNPGWLQAENVTSINYDFSLSPELVFDNTNEEAKDFNSTLFDQLEYCSMEMD